VRVKWAYDPSVFAILKIRISKSTVYKISKILKVKALPCYVCTWCIKDGEIEMPII
jgi:hypothetical protein